MTHTVTWYIHRDFGPNALFICNEGQTADCHQEPLCDCEQWTVKRDEKGAYHLAWQTSEEPTGPDEIEVRHEMKPGQTCTVLTWLNETGAIDCHDDINESIPGEAAPIQTTWTGDGYTWRYA